MARLHLRALPMDQTDLCTRPNPASFHTCIISEAQLATLKKIHKGMPDHASILSVCTETLL